MQKPKTCVCPAYAFPHRPGGGLCRWPGRPTKCWRGQVGKNQPTDLRRRGMRRWLCRKYKLHPIRDRKKIKRLLPRLYGAWYRQCYGED